jgi:hypothetical protein
MSWSHRLATLEPSPSFATVMPTNPSTTNDPSRSSPFERRLAKYRSLPLLWLRTCGSSSHHERRRSTADQLEKDSILLSLGQFGESEHVSDLLFTFDSFSSREKSVSCIRKEECREHFLKHCFLSSAPLLPDAYICIFDLRDEEQNPSICFSFSKSQSHSGAFTLVTLVVE